MQREIDRLSSVDSVDERSIALRAFAPHISDALLGRAVATACTISDSGYLYESRRATALAALFGRLRTMPSADLQRVWRDALHALAGHPRGDLFWDLAALAPIPLRLGGAEAVTEMICTLVRVQRWWP